MNKKIFIGGCALVASAASMFADKTQNGAKDVSYFNPYASIKAGVGFLGSRDGIKYKSGFAGGAEMGVSYDAWRVGFEIAYRQSKIKHVNNSIPKLADGKEVPDVDKMIEIMGMTEEPKVQRYLYKLDKLNALSGMVNLSYDYAMTEQWSVYAGVGLGVASVAYETPSVGISDKAISGVANVDDYKKLSHVGKNSRTQNVFAWQAMAGVGLEFTENWKLTLGYRVFNTGKMKFVDGKKIKTPFSHTVEGGLIYSF